FRRRVAAADTIIRDALAAVPGTWAVSISGGKDSTVLLDLCVRAGWRGPVFNFFDREIPTANHAAVRLLAERYELELHQLAVPGAWDVYERAGRFFVHPETAEERRLVNWMLAEFKRLANDYASTQGWVGTFWGMRASESRPRAFTV